MMGLMIYQVDAFTDKPFRGNPAGVCVLKETANETWMQLVAREMNLSETAFLVPVEDGFNLRWFTPVAEVELCGHGTLASAHLLYESGILQVDEQVCFHTLSGVLKAAKVGDFIELDFPSTPAKACESPPGLLEALGAEAIFVGKNKFDYLVEVDQKADLRCLEPDFGALKELGTRGVMVTSISDVPEYDFISRFFAPGVGIDEDPVTGSAHTCLGPYWQTKLGKDEMVAYQASARGGVVHVRVAPDRVYLQGQAVTVFKAEMYV
jgi:PhzF family phenazine biosynthesis protein